MLAALHAQRPDMAIGFEMFPRRLQPVLDRWVDGQLGVREFLSQAEWEQVWNFPPQLYLPLFEFARINRIPMIALNVDQKLTRAIADKGWQGVPAAEREGVGRPAAALPAYRDLLRELHRSHLAGRRQAGKGDNSFENFLDAQLAWDRAMAEALAARLGPAGVLDRQDRGRRRSPGGQQPVPDRARAPSTYRACRGSTTPWPWPSRPRSTCSSS